MNIDIGIDCDEVICHTIDKLINRAKTCYDIDIKLEDLTDFKLEKILPRGDDIKKLFLEPKFYENLELKKGAYDVIQRLINDGEDVFVVTAIPTHCVPERAKWFKEKLPYMNHDNIMYCTRKDKVYAKVLLDDALHNLDASVVEYPILFERPWNLSGRDRYVTVYSWEEFYEVIAMIKEGISYKELRNVWRERRIV